MPKPPSALKPGAAPGVLVPAAPSSMAFGLNIETVVEAQNHWREYYNPLPALNLQRARALYDFARRGLNAELQNVYREMEGLFSPLFALIARRTAPLLEMDLNWKVIPDDKLPQGATPAMARAQADCLRDAYGRIDNLYEAIEWLELGAFRGYSHLEKIYANPGTADFTISHLEPVEQWHWTRKSMYAQWEYVATAAQTNAGVPINESQFVIHQVMRPMDRIALICWIRNSLCEKDWDAFIEIYGIPHWIVIMPPNVPPEKEALYLGAARNIAQGGSGALPNGADAKAADKPRDSNPFRPRLDWLQEQLVLAGTGGLLTMLAMPTGLNSSNSETHADAFEQLSKQEARKLTAVFNRQIDAPLLAQNFPGQPVCAYFEIAAQEETDVASFITGVLNLSQAGYQVCPLQIVEKTGYEVTLKAPPPAPSDPFDEFNPADPEEEGDDAEEDDDEQEQPAINNRAVTDGPDTALIAASLKPLYLARQRDLAPLINRMHGIVELDDPRLIQNALEKLRADLSDPKSEIIQNALRNPAAAKALADAMTAGLFNGMAQAEAAHSGKPILNGGPGSGPRPGGGGKPPTSDSLGPWVDKNGGGLSVRNNVKRGNKAMDRCLRQKADVQKAMYRKGPGRIDFEHGTPGETDNDFKGGKGISHIVAKHGEEDARQMPLVLAKGKISPHPEGPQKLLVEHGPYVASLARKNSRSAFVLTGFKRKEG